MYICVNVCHFCMHICNVPVILCCYSPRTAYKFVTKLLPSLNKVLLTYLFSDNIKYDEPIGNSNHLA